MRDILIRSDGTTETLSSDKFGFSADLRELQIRGLGSNNEGAQLVTTVEKTKIKAKKKLRIELDLLLLISQQIHLLELDQRQQMMD